MSRANDKSSRWVYPAAMLVCMLFLIWKSFHGIGTEDEVFYLSLPYRMAQGDRMVTEEWQLVQLYSFALYPIMKLYLALRSNTDGMVLHFRWIYLLFQFCGSLYLYKRLHKEHALGAALGSFLFLLATPYNIMALSYNTIGLLCFAVTVITIVTEREYSRKTCIAVGLVFALSVLCCPFLIFLYAVFGCCAGISGWRMHDRRYPAAFFWFTCGCALMALVFLIFLLTKSSVPEILQVLPYIFTDDSHGNAASALLPRFLRFCWKSVPCAPAVNTVYLVLLAGAFADRKRSFRKLLFCAATVNTGFYLVLLMVFDRFVNTLSYPILILGFFAVLLSDERKSRPLLMVYLPTVVYSFCICSSSDQQFHALSFVTCAGAAYSFLPILRLTEELSKGRKWDWQRVAAWCVIMFLFGSVLLLRWKQTQRDGSTYMQHSVISVGVHKGIVATEERKEAYEAYYHESAPIREAEGENVFYYTQYCDLYLSDSKRCASFSTWLGGLWSETVMPKLQSYYRIFPEKIPDYIFLGEEMWYGPEEFLNRLGLTGSYAETEHAYLITVDKP